MASDGRGHRYAPDNLLTLFRRQKFQSPLPGVERAIEEQDMVESYRAFGRHHSRGDWLVEANKYLIMYMFEVLIVMT